MLSGIIGGRALFLSRYAQAKHIVGGMGAGFKAGTNRNRPP